jgi:two-component system, OmpR family, sensor kinase
VSRVALISPPMTTVASGCCTSAPGHIVVRSENAPDTPFSVMRQAGFTISRSTKSTPSRRLPTVISSRLPSPPYTGLRRAVALTVGPLLLFLPLSWFLIRWAVFWSMRSLDLLRSEIGRRDGSNLSQIPDMGLPTELASMLAAVNRLPGYGASVCGKQRT